MISENKGKENIYPMRINRKKQVLESIQMMKECHQHIGNTSNEGEILELLQLCQDMAVQVGNLVECQAFLKMSQNK